tara:strand:+ start:576 stop:1394 length:819 start_codon:yes stop_codon:yes gene_type:complete
MQNSKKILAELVSLDAWFDAYMQGQDIPLQVAASFSEGRFGAEPDSPVRFKASLKKAVIQIHLGSEFKVVKSSRYTKGPKTATKYLEKTQAKSSQSMTDQLEVNTAIAADMTGVKGSAQTSAKIADNAQQEGSSEFSREQEVRHHIEVYHRLRNGAEEWECTPLQAQHLRGPAFEDDASPLKFQIQPNSNFRDGLIKVKITCASEDIDITELEEKPNFRQRIAFGRGEKAKKKIAIALIQEMIAQEGLEVTNMKEAFSEVTLADVIALPEND